VSIDCLVSPFSSLIIANPSRQVAAFFLGWVFFYSVQIILSYLIWENLTRACSSFLTLITRPIKGHHELNDIEAPTPTAPATTPRCKENALKGNTELDNSSTTSQLRAREGNALLIILALCFTCASAAHFASLLRYTTAGGTACGAQTSLDTIRPR